MTAAPRPAVPIAIIGLGCRFPGGVRDAASYWDLLARGRCAIREIPPQRWSLAGFHDAAPDLPDRSISKWGGFLDDIGGFDPAFFGITPREAEGMDPQQRLLLMIAAEAAGDARLPLSALRRASTGVFIGVSNVDYGLLQRYRPGAGEQQAGTGTALSIVANRVSNRLDLSGPSLGVDTACSSALVAVDIACRNLADGACDLALAGGVNVLLDSRMFITFSRAHMLSPSGRIRAFDAGADGFVRGEGAGVVLLKRLDDAIADSDPVLAVIEATAVNQDGRTGTITAPNGEAQAAMLRAALARGGIGPDAISYVEAHGTGTPVGDPIEAKAIGAALGHARGRDAPLPVGSVKTNIGHLEPAAGIAGLIKAALVLQHRQIPPSLGFERANPAIDLEGLGLAVPTAQLPLRATDGASRVMVNSFGFGGTNACAVVRSAKINERAMAPARGAHARRPGTQGENCGPLPIPLSGPTRRHMEAFAARLVRAIDEGEFTNASLAEIAAALATQCDHGEHRAVLIAASMEELRERLDHLATARALPARDRRAPPDIVEGKPRSAPRLVLTMTGQGGQWWAMGRELFQREPVFRGVFEDFDRVFAPFAGWSVIDALLADESASRIDDAAITPAVMFAFQAGLAAVWRARGIEPEIVLGHSFGEVTAAYLAGGIGQTEVARLVTHRGLIRGKVDRCGTMAAIGLGADAIQAWLPADGSIEIGGYNSPQMVTLTGEEAAIDTLIARLLAHDPSIITRKLALDFAYHSSWFEPVEGVFKNDVDALSTSPPKLPVISTVTGALNADFSADYWWRNLRQPVLYQQGIDTALDMGGDVFLEIGPHRTLSSMTAACAAARAVDVTTVSTLDRGWGDLVSLAVATAQLYVAGVVIDWCAVTGANGRNVRLPARPWLLRAVWSEPEEAARHMRPTSVHALCGRSDDGPSPTWTSHVSLASHPWLGDHRLDGACVMPAAAYLEMMVYAARQAMGCDGVELVDVSFPTALYIGADDEIVLQTRYDPLLRRIGIHSRARGSDAWDLRASARAYRFDGAAHATEISGPAHGGTALDAAAFYREAEALGYGWGRHFRCLTTIAIDQAGAFAEIRGSVPGKAFSFDPATVDAGLQLMLATEAMAHRPRRIPQRIERVVATGVLGTSVVARLTRQGGDASGEDVCSIAVRDEHSSGSLRIERLHAKPWPQRLARDERGAGGARFYVETFEPIEIANSLPHTGGSWVWIGVSGCAVTGQLVSALKQRGHDVELVETTPDALDRGDTLSARLRDAFGRRHDAGVVNALALRDGATTGIALAARTLVTRALTFAQSLAAATSAQASATRVVILTRGARAVTADASVTDDGVAQAALYGFYRTLAMEMAGVEVQLVDLGQIDHRTIELLCDVLGAPVGETEVALSDGRALGARLAEVARDELVVRRITRAEAGETLNFALRRPGGQGADGLRWQEQPQVLPAADEVLIEVSAVGLNFRDVMAVSGLLPADAEPVPAIETLGLEMSGTVIATGRGVTDFKPGDRVLGMGASALQRFVSWPHARLARVPDELSFAEAATLPSAYLTAHYALNVVGRLAAGETVLIHSAAGGVGLAAIALARRAGARIFATAGSEEKRAHLRDLGVALVASSRDLAFAEAVLDATGGRGVDVILNSLSSDAVDKSLQCLAPYGRFLELGKRDIYGDGAVMLKALRANGSFHVIDLAAMIRDKPAEAGRRLGEVMEMRARGEIDALPHAAYPCGDVRSAFAAFSAARHIGKVVVEMHDPAVKIERSSDARLDAKGTYLVTGGTRGFGARVAAWLIARGAGRVVVASRFAALASHSEGRLQSMPLDIADEDATDKTIARIARGDMPLRGVVHAAVIYDDAAISEMTAQHVANAMAPKVAGAMNLTTAIERHAQGLDFFVSFSSLAAGIGWPGQANYAAANAFLEGFALWQRARGIPGQCIAWGALGQSGHVARSKEMQAFLDSAGWIAMPDEAALDALGAALASAAPIVTIAAADWSRLAALYPLIERTPRTRGLAARNAPYGTSGSGRAGLAGLAGAALQQAALDLVRREAAKVLRIEPAELAGVARLDEAGIDSLSSFELRNRIGQATGIDVPMSRYSKARTFAALAAVVIELFDEAERQRSQQAPSEIIRTPWLSSHGPTR